VADYGVNINFRVVGMSKVDRATAKAKQLEESVNRIRDFDLAKAMPGKVGDRISEATGQIRKYAQQINKAKKSQDSFKEVIGKTQNQQEAALEAFEETRDSVQKGSVIYDEMTDAIHNQKNAMAKQDKILKGETLSKNKNSEATIKNTKAQKEAALARLKLMKTVGGVLGSATIGGAFPFLFGQTGIAAVGGAVGGAAGGALAAVPGFQQFGFALSIAGTAIGQYLDQQEKLNKSITKVNSLFISMGDGATFSTKEVKNLAKEIGITNEEVVKLLDTNKRFGKEGSSALISFFGADTDKRIGQLQAISQVENLATAMKAIQTLGKDITIEDEFKLINMARQEGSLAVQIEMQRIILKIQHKQNIEEAERLKLGTRFNVLVGQSVKALVESLGYEHMGEISVGKILQDQIDAAIKKYEELDASLVESLKKIQGLANAYSDARLTIADEIDNMNKKIKVMVDAQSQVVMASRQIKESFADSFKGIIKGTMTVTDAFRNMLNKIADYFLDTAAQLAAMQLQKGFLGFMGNIFPSLRKSDVGLDGTKAAGGPVRGGGTYLVGERGPELFTPGISGGITPNHALGGGTSVVVNVDASGSSVEGDEDRGRELGRLISVAVQSELVQQKRPGGLLA
jgi:hypothetical protein